MLKNIVNLEGATALNTNEQKAIQGGDAYCQGGCAGKNQGDPCYTESGGCRSVGHGTCGYQLGQLVCIPN